MIDEQVTPTELLKARALDAARKDPYAFARLVSGKNFLVTRHQEHMMQQMHHTAQTNGRLIMSVAVRHTKSTTCAELFPAWWLAHHPEQTFIIGSSESELSARSSARSRDLLNKWGPSLTGIGVDQHSHSRKRWNTRNTQTDETLQGGITSVGRGGSPEGRGGNLIIDDPYRSYQDAMSQLTRKQVKEWWINTLTHRLEADSFAVILCARWHEDDLSGFLLREFGGEWAECRLPAIADSVDDPLGREVGEALWPERWGLERLERARRETTSTDGSGTWFARYQQSPLALASHMFPADRWVWVEGDDPIVGECVQTVIGWDLAATDGGGDWTVGAVLGRLPDRRVVVLEVVRGRWGVDERDRQIRLLAERWGPKVVTVIPQDPGAAGKAEAVRLGRLLAPFRSRIVLPTGAKDVRAAGWAGHVQSGSVLIVRSEAARQFVACHSDFNGHAGGQDDDVDAAGDAYRELFRVSDQVVAGTGAAYV